MTTPEQTFYKRYTGGYTGHALTNQQHVQALFDPGGRYRLVKEHIEPLGGESKNRSLLEIGCGNGDSLRWLQAHYSLKSLRGFDIALETAVNEGALVLEPANLNHPLPVEQGSVDIFVAMMIIEHLFDPFAAFREVARCLSSKGRGFINLPLITSYKNRLRLLVGKMPETSVPYSHWLTDQHWDGFHLHNFTIKSIVDLCDYTDLRIIQIRAVGPGSRIKSLVPSLLANEISFEVSRK